MKPTKNISRWTVQWICGCASLAIAACGGGGGNDDPPPPPAPTYTVGGTVTGLTGTGLVLANNGGNNLSISANGAFAFTTALASGATYAVTVITQPSAPAQTCTVANGSGTVASANITNVTVTCAAPAITVGGTVSGLTGTGLVLQNNGANDYLVGSNGAFVFDAAIASGGSYNVTVRTPPSAPIQQCTVTNGSGTNITASVNNIVVACADVVPRFVYSVNFSAGTFSSFRVDALNGELRTAGYAKVGTGPVGFRVVPSPLNANVGFAYTLNQTSMDITASTIDRTTAALTGAIAGSPFALPSAPSSFVSHPNNRFLYVLHGAAANISTYAINDTTGVLTPVVGGVVATGTTPTRLTFDAAGQFAYVANQGSANIYVYSVNSNTGVLTEVVANRVTTGSTPQGLNFLPSGGFAYHVNNQSSNIAGYAVNATTGALTLVAGSPFAAGTNPSNIAFHPNGRFLYEVNFGSANLSAYAINATTGVLTPLGGSPYPTGLNPGPVTFDVTGRFMYVPNSSTTNPNISVFTVDAATGVLAAVGTPVVTGPSPRIVGEPSGKYLYVGNNNNSSIASYHISQTTGALTPFTNTPAIATGLGPIFLLSSTASTTPVTVIPKHVYIANDGGLGNGSLASYSVNSTTGLLSATGSTSPTGVLPSGVAATRNGKFVYAVNYGSNTISAYASDNGALTPIVGGSTATPALPHFMAIEGGGRFAYAAHDTTISAYAINANTGVLTQIGTPIAAGNFPETLAADNSGRCLFAANNGSNNVSAYLINSTTGVLTAASGSPFASGGSPIEIAIHPSGRFVYVTNDADNTVSSYAITTGFGSTCALTPIAGSPFAAGAPSLGLTSIAFEPTGRFAYASNEVTDTVSIFSVNQTTGALSLVGSPVAVANANGVIVDPSGKFLYVARNLAAQDLVAYSINATTGAITPVAGGVLAIPNANAGVITGELQL